MPRNSFIEGLESRTFLSATPAPVLFNSTIQLDRIHVKIDLLRFNAHIIAGDVKLSNDLHRINRKTPAGDTSLVASIAQLKTDSATLKSQLQQDRLTEQQNAVTDEGVIKVDILQIKKDKGNTTAETADHAKLTTDRVQLQTDLIAGLDSRIATRQSFDTTISNDTQAIVTAATGDTQATPALTAAVTKFAADRVNVLNKLTNDLTIIETARQKLANDLTAAEST